MQYDSQDAHVARWRRWLGAISLALALLALAGFPVLVALVHWRPSRDSLARDGLWLSTWAAGPAAAIALLALAAVLLAQPAKARTRAGRWGHLLGGLGFLLGVLAAVFTPMLPLLGESEPERKVQCLSNVKQLALAIQMYAADYERYPIATDWSDASLGYVRKRDLHQCPDAPDGTGYAYNTALGGLSANALPAPDSLIAIFESDRGWNAHGGNELLPDFPRHLRGDNYGFPDGHAKWTARRRPPGELRWNTIWPREVEDSRVQWQPRP